MAKGGADMVSNNGKGSLTVSGHGKSSIYFPCQHRISADQCKACKGGIALVNVELQNSKPVIVLTFMPACVLVSSFPMTRDNARRLETKITLKPGEDLIETVIPCFGNQKISSLNHGQTIKIDNVGSDPNQPGLYHLGFSFHEDGEAILRGNKYFVYTLNELTRDPFSWFKYSPLR